MPRKIHVTNSAQRDATVTMKGLRPTGGVELALPDGPVSFRRYLSTTEEGLHEDLVAHFGEDYAQALIDGDPETDMEQVGRFLGSMDTVYLSAEGHVLHASPQVVEIVLDPAGQERERRVPQDVPGNVNDELPVRWTGRKIPKDQAVRRFAFTRAIQLRHVDGLTYDYLYAMARELADESVMMLVGAGADGKSPLIFQANGSPYRGFLEARVDGERYQLVLHLSNTELKLPPPPEPAGDEAASDSGAAGDDAGTGDSGS